MDVSMAVVVFRAAASAVMSIFWRQARQIVFTPESLRRGLLSEEFR
jgi:hypothetical protein